MPAAASRCPIWALTAPNAQCPGTGPPPPAVNASFSASNSMGSPIAVAVPCVSTYPIVAGSTSATSCAVRITAAWPCELGATKPTFWPPSLLIAVPLITARMWSPSRRASASGLRTTAPTPLPPTVPPACSSKGRQCPSADRIPPSWYRCPPCCGSRTETPPAMARSHSRASSAWQAWWTATSEVEQALCTVTAGPSRSRWYATRVASMSLSFARTRSYWPTRPTSARLGSRCRSR